MGNKSKYKFGNIVNTGGGNISVYVESPTADGKQNDNEQIKIDDMINTVSSGKSTRWGEVTAAVALIASICTILSYSQQVWDILKVYMSTPIGKHEIPTLSIMLPIVAATIFLVCVALVCFLGRLKKEKIVCIKGLPHSYWVYNKGRNTMTRIKSRTCPICGSYSKYKIEVKKDDLGKWGIFCPHCGLKKSITLDELNLSSDELFKERKAAQQSKKKQNQNEK